MIEERLERLENLMTQLIGMVGNLRADNEELKARFDGLEARFEGLETRFEGLEARFEGLEAKVEANHGELMSQINILKRDNDFIKHKLFEHENEIYHIKKQIAG